MPVGKIEFNLQDEGDQFEVAVKYLDMYFAIFEFDNQLRDIIKHKYEEHSGDYIEAIEDARDMLLNVLNERRIDMDMLE